MMSSTAIDPGAPPPSAQALGSAPMNRMHSRAGSEKEEIYIHYSDNAPPPDHHARETTNETTVNRYWAENIKLLLSLLAIWFVVSFGAGILFVEQLNKFSLGGYPLGFWFAQQGSIYVFVALIFFYSYRMKKIERRYGVDDDE